MNSIAYQKSGFTIVELLIVIVVIGVLAGVTVIAFKGVSDRAQASKVGSAVASFAKILELYKAQNGSYPDPGTAAPNMACIGQVTDYPAKDGFGAGECDTDTTKIAVSTQLNNALSPFASPMPNGIFPPQYWDNQYPQYGKVRGVTYRYFGPNSVNVYYSLPGTQQCPRGNTSYDTYGGILVT